MMQEWKIKQKLYHKLNKDYEDDLTDADIEITEDIAFHAIRYFKEKDIGWIYPSKSYMVAICYAFWIMEDYDENFYSVLKDPELLPMDPYFVPYMDDRSTYDEIISIVCYNNKGKLTTEGMVLDVREYYDAEIGNKFSLSNVNEI